jgi:hypothetical protein
MRGLMHAPSFRRICWTYHSCGLIAVAICEDPWYRITRDAAQEAVGRRLEIPQGDVVVDFFPPQGFLLLLPEPGLRDRALSSNGGLAVGRAKLQLLPWMRKAGAEAAKLPFRVRLCIEGLPPHARREEIVRKLLPQATLFEGFDRRHRSDGEASCCCIIVWARDPDEFAKEGTLRLEELPDRPRATWHFADSDFTLRRRPRAGPVRVLCYTVILHVDHITDFRPTATASAEWPERHSFRWRLGFRDDWRLVSPRPAVHDRLGPRKRYRSPTATTARGGPRAKAITGRRGPMGLAPKVWPPRAKQPMAVWADQHGKQVLRAKGGAAGLARQETAYACGSVGDGCGPVHAAGTRTAHPPLPSLAMSANACNTTNSIFAMNLLRDACA